MNKQPILSLCIPTNGAVKWILPVIESIYSQGYDNDKFEVVITDNGKDTQLPQHIAKMEYPNLRYRQTTDKGFLNLVTCLKEGRGLFCKMVNHRSVLLPRSIEEIVNLVERYQETQPIIYFSDGNVKLRENECLYTNTDTFVRNLSYWCSWSAGIGFWQKDIVNIDEVKLNGMFPNMSLLFDIRPNPCYVIWNRRYQQMLDDSGKGGFNLFEIWCVEFIDILNNLRVNNIISKDSFIKVKNDLRCHLKRVYFNEVLLRPSHTFQLENIRQSMDVYFGKYDYWYVVLIAWLHYPAYVLKRMIKAIVR